MGKQNLSNYSENNTIGSVHWLNTLMSQISRIGEYMNTNGSCPHPIEWGTQLQNIAKDVMEWRKNEVHKLDADELWDIYSEFVDDDIDSLTTIAGRSVVTEQSFKKLIKELKVI